MSLVVEDGSQKSDAESYITVAQFLAYHAKHGNPAAAVDASEQTVEAACRAGTQYLDGEYGRRWCGTRSTTTQRLDWPRIGAGKSYPGAYYATNEMPEALLDATCEASLRHLSSDIYADVTNSGALKSKMVKAGSVQKSVAYSGSNPPVTWYRVVEGLLRPLIKARNVHERS